MHASNYFCKKNHKKDKSEINDNVPTEKEEERNGRGRGGNVILSKSESNHKET